MIDTHAHLYECEGTMDALLERAREKGVTRIIQVGVNLEISQKVWELAQRYPMTVPTAGIHPLYKEDFDKLEALEQHLQSCSVCAIGETGLDYKYDCDKAKQHEVFEFQLNLARKYQKPVVVHTRMADEDTISVVKKYPDLRFVFHCFSSGPEFVDAVSREGVYFSFTGLITYTKETKILESVKHIPLEKMMIETDCPYLTPLRYKGQKNESSFVGEVALKIAELKGVSVLEVIETTTRVAEAFFSLR